MEPTSKQRRLDAAWLLEVISSQRRGPAASLLRGVLWIGQFPYGWVVRLRNWQFDAGWRRVRRVEVPVISVGNLTTGGTGKTPLVAWFARQLRRHQLRVALVSRGYGARPGTVNDEALELQQQLPDVPHLQQADRVAAARSALGQFQSQVILLDDAFQHRRIHRDLDVVLLDALQPWGHGYLLPRGLLREPQAGLRRAHAVGLSRADLISPAERDAIREQVERLRPDALWFEMRHRPKHLVDSQGAEQPLPSETPVPVLAFCGLGNPSGFRHSLEQCGYQILDWREFPDHHPYSREDIAWLAAWSDQHHSARQILCTRKDLVKLGRDSLGALPLRALAIEAEFLRGEAELVARLRQLLSTVTS